MEEDEAIYKVVICVTADWAEPADRGQEIPANDGEQWPASQLQLSLVSTQDWGTGTFFTIFIFMRVDRGQTGANDSGKL